MSPKVGKKVQKFVGFFDNFSGKNGWRDRLEMCRRRRLTSVARFDFFFRIFRAREVDNLNKFVIYLYQVFVECTFLLCILFCSTMPVNGIKMRLKWTHILFIFYTFSLNFKTI